MDTSEMISIDEHAYDDIRPYIKDKDGYQHILVLHATTTLSVNPFQCETRFTMQMDDFLLRMQKDGYEVLNIRISPMGNPNILGAVSGFSIVINYK